MRRTLGTTMVVMGCIGALIQAPVQARPHPSAPRCSIFPADNVWHADVSRLPVHARSAQWISSSGGSRQHLHPDFGPSGAAQPYGIPYNIADSSHAKVSVDFTYSDESDHVQYPLGSDTTIEAGSDAHAIMLNKDTCTLYEIFDTSHTANGWHGGSGAVFDLSSNALRHDTWTSADAAGLPIFAGLIRRDEITAGEIDHAIRMTVSRSDRRYLWPARHQAGAADDQTLPPMGAWFRLKQSFDVSRYGAPTRVVLNAMKKHGMIVADNGSDWYFGGTAEDGWDETTLNELKSITAGSFEAIDASSLMVDRNSGRIHTGPRRRVGITIQASPTRTLAGRSTTLSGRITPPHPGLRVLLQKLDGARRTWSTVRTLTLNARGVFDTSYRRTQRGYLVFRAVFPTQDGDHASNTSPSIRIDWT
ncbi:MAG: hypothetical protein NVSMB57_10490 [Actinomycetota bacterium]